MKSNIIMTVLLLLILLLQIYLVLVSSGFRPIDASVFGVPSEFDGTVLRTADPSAFVESVATGDGLESASIFEPRTLSGSVVSATIDYISIRDITTGEETEIAVDATTTLELSVSSDVADSVILEVYDAELVSVGANVQVFVMEDQETPVALHIILQTE